MARDHTTQEEKVQELEARIEELEAKLERVDRVVDGVRINGHLHVTEDISFTST